MHRVDVDAMLAEVPCRQYQEWKAFYEIDPWGERRADMQNALLMWWIAVIHCGKKNVQSKPEDLLLFPEGGPPEPQSMESMAGVAKTYAMMFGTVIKAQ